jgi:hypothetical protein
MATIPTFQVNRRGIYTITFSFGATPSSGDVELFLSKNLTNGADLAPTTVNQLLASTRLFTQNSLSWTGYINTTDYFSLGGYAHVAVTPTANSELTITLVDGAEGPTGQTGPAPALSTTALQPSMTIGATTTAPTITTTTLQQINTTQLSSDQYRVRYRLGWSSATAGSGEYLVSLPSPLTFRTTAGYHPIYTGALWAPNVSAMAPYLIPCVGGVVQSGNWNGTAYVIPYSTTQFRVVLDSNTINSFGTWSSTWFPMSTEGAFHIEFDMWV